MLELFIIIQKKIRKYYTHFRKAKEFFKQFCQFLNKIFFHTRIFMSIISRVKALAGPK